jgi:hypothetical protein
MTGAVDSTRFSPSNLVSCNISHVRMLRLTKPNGVFVHEDRDTEWGKFLVAKALDLG